MRRLALLLAVLSTLVGSPAYVAGPSLPPIVVAGCEVWRTGKICIPGIDGLKIWVPGEPASLLVDGRPRAAKPQKRPGGGRLYEIGSLAEASRLSVVTAAGRYELTLAASDRPAWYDGVKEKMKDRTAEAEKELNALNRLSPGDNAYKLYLLSRLQLRRADRASLALMAAKQWGDSSSAVRDFVNAAQLFHEEGDYARRDLALRDAWLAAERLRSAEIVPFLPFYYLHDLEAYFAIDRGDLRGALDQLEALDAFDQQGVFEKWEHHAWKDERKALVLIELGRFEEARELLDKLLEQAPAGGDRAATRAEALVNRGWAAYLAREAGRPGPDPLPSFEEAWILQRGSQDDGIRFGGKLNLAAATLQAGRPEEAARHLEEAAAFQAGASVVHLFQARELGARLLLLQGKAAEAHQRFFELDRDASLRRLPALRWMALLGRAEAAAALGRAGEALDALEVAAQLGNSELLLIPPNKGRETFLARRDRATRLELQLMLDRGNTAQAWKTFFWRLTQTQRLLQNDEILAGFDEKQRARRDSLLALYRENLEGLAAQSSDPAASPVQKAKLQQTRLAERTANLDQIRDSLFDQLGSSQSRIDFEVEPGPGELVLGFFPLEKGWMALARSQRELVVRRLEAPLPVSPEEIAKGLLALFRKEISAAARIKIFPWGDLNEVEFHLLESSKPVIYGVAAGRSRAPFAPLEKALLVENPMKDLGSAVAEIALVKKTLQERSPGIRLIVPLTENATPRAVWQDLEKADFLHFAGHSAAGEGYGGFEGMLVLRHGDLPLGDLLALRRVPRLVVLSSCEAGRDRDRKSGEKGLGLAQAFVLAGSDQVLAATEAVDDIKTARLMEEIYRRWPTGEEAIDLAVLLFEARTSLRQKSSDPTWDSFRVFEP